MNKELSPSTELTPRERQRMLFGLVIVLVAVGIVCLRALTSVAGLIDAGIGVMVGFCAMAGMDLILNNRQTEVTESDFGNKTHVSVSSEPLSPPGEANS